MLKTKFLISLSLCSFAVEANVMEDVFDGYTTGHEPTTYESHTRKGIALGAVSYRSGSMLNQNIVSFRPPSATAGCNGIDVQLGSFSMIKDLAGELQNAMRQIAAGAASYAFNLALDALCPTCAANIKSLKDKMDQWNRFFKDSCQAGQALAATVTSPYTEEIKSSLSFGMGAADNGYVDDASNFFSMIPDVPTIGQLATDLNVPTSTLEGNLLFAAAEQIDSQIEIDYPRFKETLMSLVGTRVARIVDTDGAKDEAGNPLSDLSSEPVLAVTSLATFIYGKQEDASATGEAKIFLYRCDNDKCLSPTNELQTDTPALANHFVNVMQGKDSASDGTGMLEIYRSGGRQGSDFSSSQQQLVKFGSLGIYRYVEILATYYTTDAEVAQFYEPIAMLYADHYADMYFAAGKRYLLAIKDFGRAKGEGEIEHWADEALTRFMQDHREAKEYFRKHAKTDLLRDLNKKAMEANY